MTSEIPRQLAQIDFDKARKDSILIDVYNRMLGRSTELLAFEDVQRSLGGLQGVSGIRREILLDSIVGSVGRYNDFNRDFLPRSQHDRERWANVKVAMETNAGLPPIEVYQVGEVYFVVDGNHRVSIAKRRGDTYIMANITEINTRVGLSPEDTPQDLIAKAEYRQFLETTELDDAVPDADLRVSEIGLYGALLQQIELVHFQISRKAGREVPLSEAAIGWYNDYYLPVIEVLREQNLLRFYPKRTETDLYIWLLENRQAIQDEMGWSLQLDSIAAELSAREESKSSLRNTLRGLLSPGNAAGEWRERKLAATKGKMFNDIIVLLEDDSFSGDALENAIVVAAQEEASILALLLGDFTDFEEVRSRFEAHCRSAGVTGQLSTGTGKQNEILKARTRWADLAVLPAPQPDADPHEYHELLENIHIPALVARPVNLSQRSVLLAVDDSPKSQEALFLSAYLASLWGLKLNVVAVDEGSGVSELLEAVRSYLSAYSLEANCIAAQPHGPEKSVAAAILRAAEAEQAGVIITGGHHAHKLGRHSVGHTLDTLVAEANLPILICR